MSESCQKCGSADFAIVRDMTSKRICKCGNAWAAPTSHEYEPLSKNICRLQSGGFWITGASWESLMGQTYEIGVRSKNRPDLFVLIQPDKMTRETDVPKFCEMIRVLLDAGFTPTEIQGVL